MKNGQKKQIKKVKIPEPIQKSFFSKSNHNLYIFLLILLTAVVFSNTINNGFTNWDDDKYLFENSFIKDLSLKGIKNIFNESYFSNYHPLTTLTYAVEYKFFGFNPKVFHFTNYILHILNVLLVFVFIRLISKRIEVPFITALLFAIHPMHVESVAWISERKDVLYTFFFLTSLIFSIKFIQKGSKNYYLILIAVLLFLFSLMSKSAAVTLPLVFLLCVYFINKKIAIKDIIISLPFFALSLLFGIIALKTQESSIGDLGLLYSQLNRVLITIFAIYFYIIRFIFPFNFSTLHVFPKISENFLPFEYYLAPFILIAIIVFVIIFKKDYKQVLIFGLLFFIFNILLVLQVITVGQAIVAERYTYVPYIGLSFIGAISFVKLKEKYKLKVLITGLLYTVFLIGSTWQQNKVWKNNDSLWTKAIEVNPMNSEAYYNRGNGKDLLKDYAGAIADHSKAIEINPSDAEAYNNRGTVYFKLGNFNEAIKDYYKAIEIDSLYADPYYNKGVSEVELGNYKEAISDYNKAITINPNYTKAYFNRGIVKIKIDDFGGAIEDFDKGLTINPYDAKAYNSRGSAKGRLADYKGAIEDFNKAIEINPKDAEAFYNRGIAYIMIKNTDAAIKDFKQAIKININYAEAYLNLGRSLIDVNNIEEACKSLNKAEKLGASIATELIKIYCQ